MLLSEITGNDTLTTFGHEVSVACELESSTAHI